MGVASLGAGKTALWAESNVLSQGGATKAMVRLNPRGGGVAGGTERQQEHVIGHVLEPK